MLAAAYEDQYTIQRQLYENAISFKTPARFWRCPACHKKGAEYEGLDSLIDDVRPELTALEDQLREHGAFVNPPITRGPVEQG